MVHIDNVEVSLLDYYEAYGVGIQKRIQDHFMAYGEAIVQNGGRNGISLNGGLRWAVGHNCQSTPKNKTLSDNVKKVNNVTKSTKSVAKQPQTFESKEVKQVSKTSLVQNESQTQRKVIKQLSQQSRIMINSGFTSRTPNVGIVKK